MDDPKVKKQIGPDPKIKQAFETIAETEEGRVVLKYLMQVCQYQVSTLSMDPQSQEINPLALVHNEARRRLYLHIRAFIPVAIRRKIENS